MAESIKLSEQQAALAGGLNQKLEQLDILIGKLGLGLQQNSLNILMLLDEIQNGLDQFENADISLVGETSQFESAGASLKKQVRVFLREIGGGKALQAERSRRSISEKAWWWRLDEFAAAQRRTALLRLGAGLAILIISLVVLGVLYQKFWAPRPEVIAVYKAENNSLEQIFRKNLDRAMVEVDLGLAADPNNSDLLIIKGIICQLKGNDQQSQDYFERARSIIANDEIFFVDRGQMYSSGGQIELARRDAEATLKINPNSARGYLLLGNVQEMMQDGFGAYDSYNRAALLADQQHNDSLVADIRFRLAMLMQQYSLFQKSPTPIPSATPQK